MAVLLLYWVSLPVRVGDEVVENGGLHQVQEEAWDIKREFQTTPSALFSVRKQPARYNMLYIPVSVICAIECVCVCVCVPGRTLCAYVWMYNICVCVCVCVCVLSLIHISEPTRLRLISYAVFC